MQIKDFLSKVSENRSNGQLNVCIRKGQLKKGGISKEQLFNMEVDLNKLLDN